MLSHLNDELKIEKRVKRVMHINVKFFVVLAIGLVCLAGCVSKTSSENNVQKVEKNSNTTQTLQTKEGGSGSSGAGKQIKIVNKEPVGAHWESVFEKQMNQADSIVHGRVAEITAEKGKNNYGDKFVQSEITLDVLETFKGVQSSQYTFRSLGGVINDRAYVYSHIPMFSTGEELIVFLIKVEGILVTPVGWTAAKLVVNPDGSLKPTAIPLNTFKEWLKYKLEAVP